jgi:hypothetical protein
MQRFWLYTICAIQYTENEQFMFIYKKIVKNLQFYNSLVINNMQIVKF